MLLPYSIINFPGREEALRPVTRYASYRPMFYRSNLVTHSKHVLWLVQRLLPYAEKTFGQKFDSAKAQLLALIHDDPEILMGDIEMGKKFNMTPAQLQEVEDTEQKAIEQLVDRFPKYIGDYSYEALLQEAAEKKTPEARLMKLADKFDAHGEALHEVYGGNMAFMTPVVNEYGKIILPTDYHILYLSTFTTNYPEFKKLFEHDHPFFQQPLKLDFKSIALRESPHTRESLTRETECPHYNFWKEVMLESGDEEEIKNLYMQKEYAHPPAQTTAS